MKISKPTLPQIIKQHKLIGIFLALWLFIMVLTGILLNHTSDFKLDQKPIQSKWLLALYGVSAPENGQTYKIDSQRSLHQFGEALFFNYNELKGLPKIKEQALICSSTDELFIYWPSHFALLTLDGELIESKDSIKIRDAFKIGSDTKGNFFLKSKSKLFLIDTTTLNYSETQNNNTNIKWSEVKPLSEKLISTFSEQITHNELTYERLIIDIHNGNILGSYSKYIVDFLSLFFMLLIFSGVYIWYKKISIKKKSFK